MSTCNDDQVIEPELIQAPLTLDHRRDPCSLDDAYIFNYTNNPRQGKTAALRAAGYEGKYIRQEAQRMHNRLRSKIQKVTQDLNQDFGALSNQQLHNILNSEIREVGYQAMLAAIKLGFEYSGHQPAMLGLKEERQAPGAVQQRIERLMEQIDQATGQKRLPGTE